MIPVKTLFHCTYFKNLPGIRARGIHPVSKPVLMRAAPGNLKGVYLSDETGVRFWFRRLVSWAEHDSDNPVEDGLVPVVLQVTTACDTVEDELGQRDSGSQALICTQPIEPGNIRVWDGGSWVSLSQGVDPALGTSWVDDEDFEEGGYYQLLEPHRSPLMPHL